MPRDMHFPQHAISCVILSKWGRLGCSLRCVISGRWDSSVDAQSEAMKHPEPTPTPREISQILHCIHGTLGFSPPGIIALDALAPLQVFYRRGTERTLVSGVAGCLTQKMSVSKICQWLAVCVLEQLVAVAPEEGPPLAKPNTTA